jgi:hypothetical protein
MRHCSLGNRVRRFFGKVHSVDMTTTTRPLSFIAVMALIGAACSSKDAVLRARDGAVDQSPSGTGGALPDSGGAGGALWGSGGNSSLGTGGRTTGAGGSVPGGGGSGSGGIVPGTGGVGTGGILPGTGGSGRGGSGSGGTVSTGGNSGGAIGTGGAGGQGGTGQGGTGQGGTAWYDAGTDAAVDASQPECPSSAPGGSCSVSSTIICYYGDDTRWFCKTSAKCSQGTWVVSDPMPECTATPDPSCPADPATGPVPTCSTDGGTNPTCVYSTQFCKCGYGGTPWPSWKCSANLPAECPALRPGDGSPCTTTSGVWCTYGLSCSGSDMQCIEGKWVTLLLACA